MKKLSIITPTYNSSKFLLQCLESVKAQNLNKDVFEHIFVDGNSTDKTLDIINKYKQETEYDIQILEREPKGVYNAVNQGALNAIGEYLLFLNSDDWLEPDILYNYLTFIKKTNRKDLYYGDIVFNNGNKTYKSDSSNRKNKIAFKLGGFNILIRYPSVLIKRKTFMELGMFDESKKIASDYGFWLNILKNNKEYIYYPKVVTNFRVHDGGISSNKKNQSLNTQECKYFQNKYLPLYKKFIRNILLIIWKIEGCLIYFFKFIFK